MADDKLTVALAEIRLRGYRNGAGGALCARLSDCAAIDVPRLLAAVDAALRFHAPKETANGIQVCAFCSCAQGEAVTSPCPEVVAISRELLGEDAEV
jgi:hypothetical protein